MSNNDYQQCSRCIMDTTEPEILFNSQGVCNHCLNFDDNTSKHWYPNHDGEKKFAELIAKLKSENKNKEYDCIMGLSGGVDSSYLALRLKDWGLRALVVHVDAGWNSELAVANIEKIVQHCGFELFTHVVNWNEMKDLQLAYFRSNVANQDVPQDHVFAASLYNFAMKHNIRTVISGGNIATESVLPVSWHHGAMDSINLKAIHKKYGKIKLKTYTMVSFFDYYVKFPWVKKMQVLRPLNFMHYNKDEAISELEKIGWRSYGKKHGESIFTKFFQNHYLPEKHGIDKRLAHYSSLILSKQMTREDALNELKKPLYDPEELRNDIDYFCKKLNISHDEYNVIMKAPIHNYSDYKNWDGIYSKMKSLQNIFEKILGRKIGSYS
jgi:aminotransferase